jgi:hypothetical protein
MEARMGGWPSLQASALAARAPMAVVQVQRRQATDQARYQPHTMQEWVEGGEEKG